MVIHDTKEISTFMDTLAKETNSRLHKGADLFSARLKSKVGSKNVIVGKEKDNTIAVGVMGTKAMYKVGGTRNRFRKNGASTGSIKGNNAVQSTLSSFKTEFDNLFNNIKI